MISEQKVLKTSKNHYFYRFSTLRNQQVRCSSHPTSSKPLKTDTFSRFTPSERGLFFHVIISTNKNAGGNTEQEAEKKIFCVIYST